MINLDMKPHPMEENTPRENHPFEALGIIVPTEWDLNGKPSVWAISTYDENLYRIDTRTEEGRLLGSLLGRKIRIFGFLGSAGDGHQNIMVEKYIVLDDAEMIR